MKDYKSNSHFLGSQAFGDHHDIIGWLVSRMVCIIFYYWYFFLIRYFTGIWRTWEWNIHHILDIMFSSVSLLFILICQLDNNMLRGYIWIYHSVMKKIWLTLLGAALPSLRSTTFKCKQQREAKHLFLHRWVDNLQWHRYLIFCEQDEIPMD